MAISSGIGALIDRDGKLITVSQHTANLLDNYFSSVFNTVMQSSRPAANIRGGNSLNHNPIHGLSDIVITTRKVLNVL